MEKIFNKKEMLRVRRDLRSNLTLAEAILWNLLKDSQLGFKFRRQHSIGNYIVDFYCREKKLVLELDGEVHNNDAIAEKDIARSEYLRGLGLRVMRFENKEIMENIDGVLAYLENI